MVEVTNSNFCNVLNEFEYNVKKSSFVAIDCEFSSLPSYVSAGNSFLDSPDERYLKLKNGMDGCLVVQVGITPFKYNRDLNHYSAYPYNFYVFPRKFGSFDVNMVCSSSTINFLCDSSFDFNKVFYNGISYMKKSNVKKIRTMLKEGTLLDHVEAHLSFTEVDEILELCEKVKKWIGSADPSPLEYHIKEDNPALNYALVEEMKKLGKEIWCEVKNGKITIFKVSPDERLTLKKLSALPASHEEFLTSLRGFSRIYEILSVSRKPLVGHNLFNDLLTMYHQFYSDLPDSYKLYKKSLNELFPHIYDTKFIAIELEHLKGSDNRQTSLPSIYDSYQDTKTRFHFPQVIIDKKGIYENAEAQHSHDAGWDSYMTGFIFLKMADELVRITKMENHLVNVMSAELLNHMKKYENKIKIARCGITHLNLGGDDPVSRRPPLLHVSNFEKQRLRAVELDAAFKKYEPIYKKQLTLNSALIATPNYRCFKNILLDFSESKEFKVEKYSLVKHNRGIQAFLAAGIFVPVVLTLWFGFVK